MCSQKAKIKWIREGITIPISFHKFANGKKVKDIFIKKLEVEIGRIVNGEDLNIKGFFLLF